LVRDLSGPEGKKLLLRSNLVNAGKEDLKLVLEATL